MNHPHPTTATRPRPGISRSNARRIAAAAVVAAPLLLTPLPLHAAPTTAPVFAVAAQPDGSLRVSWPPDSALDHRVYAATPGQPWTLLATVPAPQSSAIYQGVAGRQVTFRVYADLPGSRISLTNQLTATVPPIALPTAIATTPAAVTASVYPTTESLATSPYETDRWLISFPRDSDGYTLFPIDSGAPIVGSQPGDYPDFKSAQAAAIAHAQNAVLFRRGCVYTAAQVNSYVIANGASAAQPFVVAALPTDSPALPRPILLGTLGVGGKQAVHNVVIQSLDFYDPTADSGSPQYAHHASPFEAGIRAVLPFPGNDHLWFEDVRVRDMQGGIELEDISGSTTQHVIIRRCAVDHCYTQKWGIYAQSIGDLLIHECVLDHNGWDDAGLVQKSAECHNLYLQTWSHGLSPQPSADPQTRVIANLIARAAAEGIEQRSGGILDGNCFIGNPIAGFVAKQPNALISNDVVMGAGFDLSIAPAERRGWGLFSDNTPSALMTHCAFIDKLDPLNAGSAARVMSDSSDGSPDAHTAFTGSGLIVHHWIGPALSTSGAPASVTLSNCDIDSAPGSIVGLSATPPAPSAPPATPAPPAPNDPDPDRTLARYIVAVLSHTPAGSTTAPITPPRTAPTTAPTSAPASAADFLAAAAANRRGAYDPRLTAQALNAYIFAGFAPAASAPLLPIIGTSVTTSTSH